MDYLFVTWERLERLVARLALAIRERQYDPDIIVGVSRGGLAPTRLLSDFLNVRDVIVLGVIFYEDIGRTSSQPTITHPLSRGIRGKKVILLDDVSDTGGSLGLAKKHVLSFNPSELLVCTLHRKPWSTFNPDIFIEETDRWIIYAWEKVEAASHIISRMGYKDSEAGLLDAGFSDGDLQLLRDLDAMPSEANPLTGDHDNT